MAVIRRRFVAVQDRVVHYRVAGHGIPVVLLHESPRSSRSLVPLLEALSDGLRVIAPDTPGYGSSTPLAGRFPPLGDFSAALAAFLDALGITRCVLYGSHTGGSIAADFAERYPQRVAGLVLDGFAMFTADEQQDMLDNYLPPFEPHWDGTHITGLWSRVRDLFTYFPYHRRDGGHRIATEAFSLDACYRTVLGFIDAGDHYRDGYRASITHEAQQSLRALTVPTTVVSRDTDLLRHHLDRISPDASCDRVAVTDEAWLSTIRALVVGYGDELGTAPELPAQPRGDSYLDFDEYQLRLRQFGVADGQPILFLHDLPGSGADAQQLEALLGPSFSVVAPDLPSCADSDGPEAYGPELEELVAILEDVITHTSTAPVTVVSQGAGALIGALLHERAADHVSRHVANELGTRVLSRPPVSLRDLVPDSAPRLGGGHLTDAWFQLRDGLFYGPWSERSADGRRARDPMGNAELVQARFSAWFKGPQIDNLARCLVQPLPASKPPDVVLADGDVEGTAAALRSLV